MRRILIVIALLATPKLFADTIDEGVAALKRSDFRTAFLKFKIVAAQGNSVAQAAIGEMYYFGHGVKIDYKESYKWSLESAKQGNSDGQYNLGNLYFEGKGVSKQPQKAAYWWSKSAEQGNAFAQFNLARLYDTGTGVPQDFDEAMKFYFRAAAQGLTQAQNNLGVLYGRFSNHTRAYMWFNIAAINGDEASIRGRSLSESQLTKQQLIDAQRMARECMASNFIKCD